MRVNVSKLVRLAIKCSLFSYITIAALVGTFVIVQPFMVIIWNGFFAPAPLPVSLPNGFIYTHDHDSNILKYVLLTKRHQKAVLPDVRRIMWHNDTVYGFRHGPAQEPYYFICTYGHDCSDSQHYTDTEFTYLVRAQGLPEFTYARAHTYQKLLIAYSKAHKQVEEANALQTP